MIKEGSLKPGFLQLFHQYEDYEGDDPVLAQELHELFDSFSDPELKEQLVFAASQGDEPESVDFLMEIAEDPENGELRETAIFWLGQSKDPRVPEFLLRIIGR